MKFDVEQIQFRNLNSEKKEKNLWKTYEGEWKYRRILRQTHF